MRSDWGSGTRVLVRTTAGGLVACRVGAYECEGFWRVEVLEGPQRGQKLVVHEDDATREEGAAP